MAKFMIGFSAMAGSTTAKTAMKVIGASAKAFEVVEIGVFGDGTATPTDVGHEVQAAFLTNGGAGTPGASPTPEEMAQSWAASGLTAGTAYSAEPTTYATNSFPLFAFNQRGGMRWSVPRLEGFMSSGADTNLSFGVRVDSSTTTGASVSGNCMWWE
jgi:hypothetical protein